MRPPLTIELSDEAHATALRRHLQPFDVDTVAVDGRWEVRIQLVERNPESRIVNALHAIDTWLLTSEVAEVRVRLDGSSYTLHTPPMPAEPAIR
jgi:hypothetical protein